MQTIGGRIYLLRTARHMTQSELAKLVYVDKSTVSRWEHNQAEPDYRTIVRLSIIFQVSLSYLMTGKKGF